jgi:hypothetical protein
VTSASAGGGTSAGGGSAGSANALEQDASAAKTRQLERHEAQDAQAATAAGAVNGSSSAGGTAVDVPWRLVGIGVVLILLVLLVPVTAVLGRRRRRRRAHDPRALIEAAWADLAERVSDLGVSVPTGATPRQVAARLADHLRAAREREAPVADRAAVDDGAELALHRARATVERSRYSRMGSDSSALRADAASMPDDVRTVIKQVAAGRTRAERLRAALVPASGRARLRGWTERRGRQVARVDLGAARGARLLVPRRRRA